MEEKYEKNLRKRLNREILSQLTTKPREAIEKDLLEIARITLRDAKYGDKDISEAYQKLAKNILLAYEGIDNRVENFDELKTKFSGLGFNIAFLMDKLDNSVLASEEIFWLGSMKTAEKNSGADYFEFAPYIEDLEPIKDCSPQEKTLLYLQYLNGQRKYWIANKPYPEEISVPKKIE